MNEKTIHTMHISHNSMSCNIISASVISHSFPWHFVESIRLNRPLLSLTCQGKIKCRIFRSAGELLIQISSLGQYICASVCASSYLSKAKCFWKSPNMSQNKMQKNIFSQNDVHKNRGKKIRERDLQSIGKLIRKL